MKHLSMIRSALTAQQDTVVAVQLVVEAQQKMAEHGHCQGYPVYVQQDRESQGQPQPGAHS